MANQFIIFFIKKNPFSVMKIVWSMEALLITDPKIFLDKYLPRKTLETAKTESDGSQTRFHLKPDIIRQNYWQTQNQ